MRNALREAFASGEPAAGVSITLTDPAVVEIAALAGFDFVVIDLEHGGGDLESVRNRLRAAEAGGVGSLVRMHTADASGIQRVLEAGAEGILIPGVRDAAAAREGVAAIRYPPEGIRGLNGASRAARYGAHGFPDLGALTRRANATIVAAVIVENVSAVADVDEIAAVSGLDAIFVGPTDLGASIGLAEVDREARLEAAVDRVRRACEKTGIALVLPVEHGLYRRSAEALRADGSLIVTYGVDATMLLGAFRDGVERTRNGRARI